MGYRFAILIIVCFFQLTGWSIPLYAGHSSLNDSASSVRNYDVSLLVDSIQTARSRVREFAAIRELAEKMGLRVYLFGGAAAAFAHYVRRDIEGQETALGFYDYHLSSILRSDQDADIVVDGTLEQTQAFDRALHGLPFNYIREGRSLWDVRRLRGDYGNRSGLIDNFHFLNQHSDSHSTGLIELTGDHQDLVKDVRDWDSTIPKFLADVYQSKLSYYFSPLHQQTNRAAQGINPPIFSVIRYYIKAFQYDLQIDPSDEIRLKEIIDAFVPGSMSPGYVRNWIDKHARHLFEYAVDLEDAWNRLSQVGLRQKLAKMGQALDPSSLAYLMNREPLRTREAQERSIRSDSLDDEEDDWGTTAQELGISIVAHNTKSLNAYESITRSHSGKPNVFISRQNVFGEVASYGPGFYVRRGLEGVGGNGYTIQFVVDPNARLGIDFKVCSGTDYILILNRSAIKVSPQMSRLTPLQVIDFSLNRSFQFFERGTLHRIAKRLEAEAAFIDEQQRQEFKLKVKEVMGEPRDFIGMLDAGFSFFAVSGMRELLAESVLEIILENGSVDYIRTWTSVLKSGGHRWIGSEIQKVFETRKSPENYSLSEYMDLFESGLDRFISSEFIARIDQVIADQIDSWTDDERNMFEKKVFDSFFKFLASNSSRGDLRLESNATNELIWRSVLLLWMSKSLKKKGEYLIYEFMRQYPYSKLPDVIKRKGISFVDTAALSHRRLSSMSVEENYNAVLTHREGFDSVLKLLSQSLRFTFRIQQLALVALRSHDKSLKVEVSRIDGLPEIVRQALVKNESDDQRLLIALDGFVDSDIKSFFDLVVKDSRDYGPVIKELLEMRHVFLRRSILRYLFRDRSLIERYAYLMPYFFEKLGDPIEDYEPLLRARLLKPDYKALVRAGLEKDFILRNIKVDDEVWDALYSQDFTPQVKFELLSSMMNSVVRLRRSPDVKSYEGVFDFNIVEPADVWDKFDSALNRLPLSLRSKVLKIRQRIESESFYLEASDIDVFRNPLLQTSEFDYLKDSLIVSRDRRRLLSREAIDQILGSKISCSVLLTSLSL